MPVLIDPGIGIKHKQFFNLTDQGLTFVPYFPDEPSCGLNKILPKHVIEAINKYFMHPVSIIDGSPCNYSFNISGNSSKILYLLYLLSFL